MQRLRGVLAGTLVGAGLAAYVALWLHGVREVAIVVGAGIGLAIGLVVGTRTDAHDAAGDEAWRGAAPDLPPIRDRVALERLQATMPGPDRDRGPGSGSADGDDGAAVDEEQEPQ